ncbi:MAG: AMP-binding protein [Verrucomicrobiales bacterium]|nr:AMP-binding protein [Verrucomicrobiales bacterium]
MAKVLGGAAARHPRKPFLIDAHSGREITFGGLETSARRLAGWFHSEGLRPGDRIALWLENGLPMVELLLGAFRGGLVAVPIPPAAGPSTIDHVLKHSEAAWIVTSPDGMTDLSARVPDAVRLVAIPPWEPLGETLSGSEPSEVPSPGAGDDALLIYTSGSTGVPKGVLLTHANLVAAADNAAAAHALSPTDRSLCVLPLGHLNALTVTILPSLVSGGSVVLAHRFDPRGFWDWMQLFQCTWSALVPALVGQLLEVPASTDGVQIRPGPQIRFIRSSSAPLSTHRKGDFERRFGLPVLEAMGSTEAGGAVFATPLPPRPNKAGSPGVAWGFETRWVDPDGRDVPAGSPGELLLRGPSVMRGYFRDPIATSEVLSPEGWLRTGDVGRLDDDGYLFLIGRTREIINKGGTKIAPREIEEALQSHPAVLESAVVAVPDEFWGEEIAAFVVPRPGTRISESVLLDHCAGRLGALRTPAWIQFLPELPQGPGGKPLRRLLSDAARQAPPKRPGPAVHRDFEPLLTQLWKRVLRVEDVRPGDNFFALGGHSLAAMELLAQLRRELGSGPSLAEFLRNPTVKGQAQLLSARPDPAPSATAGCAPGSPPGTPWPLTPAQLGIWFEVQARPDSFAYHELEAVSLRGHLDTEVLCEALSWVVRRHEALRSRVGLQEDLLVWEPIADGAWTPRILDLNFLPADQRLGAAKGELLQHARQPFDLEREPGLRVLLIRINPDHQILGVVFHHLICDRTSIGVFARDLSQACQALLAGRLPVWPNVGRSFGEVATELNQRLGSADAGRDLDYWRKTLDGLPPFAGFPGSRVASGSRSGDGEAGRVLHPLGPDRSHRVRQTARRFGVSPFTVILSLVQLLVVRETGQDDFVIGVPVASRDHPEWRDLFGLLVDFLPFRARPGPPAEFSRLLESTHEHLLEMLQHRSVSAIQVLAALGRADGCEPSDFCRLAVNWRHHSSELRSLRLAGMETNSFPVHAGGSKFDLILGVVDRDVELELEVDYAHRHFPQESVARWLRTWDQLLDQCLARDA